VPRIRKMLSQWLTDQVDSAVKERGLVSRERFDELTRELEQAQRALAGAQTDLGAVRQSMTLIASDLEDAADAADDLTGIADTLRDLAGADATWRGRLDMITGALATLSKHLSEVEATAATATKAGQQANQIATSAQSTAEAAVDGIIGVESELAALKTRLAQ
jgi:methyl-accepting chemotaxis protein